MALAGVSDFSRPTVPRLAAEDLKAAQSAGRGLSAMVVEMARLAIAPGKLTPAEYLAFGLHEPGRTLAEKRAFVGLSAQARMIARTVDPAGVLLAHDKLHFAAAMTGLGLPTPSVLAIVHRSRSFAGTAATLRGAAELAAWLRGACYPLIMKPVTGMFSRGVVSLEGYDAAQDCVTSADGETVAVDRLAAELDLDSREGYLVQPRLSPDPAIAAICGDRLATCRLIVRLEDSGPVLQAALWKIPAGRNVADNFWRSGNLLARLDHESGRVEMAFTGTGPRRKTITHHPDTGAAVTGFAIPGWPALRDLTLAAARTQDWLRLQAWDVAATASGPMLIELNIGGDASLPQLATGRGLLTPEFEAFLSRCDTWRRERIRAR